MQQVSTAEYLAILKVVDSVIQKNEKLIKQANFVLRQEKGSQ